MRGIGFGYGSLFLTFRLSLPRGLYGLFIHGKVLCSVLFSLSKAYFRRSSL